MMIKTIKKFFSRPAKLNLAQKIIYTIWILLLIICVIGAISIDTSDSSSSSILLLIIIPITYIRNKLFQAWE